MQRKLVYEEAYQGHVIRIHAQFADDCSIKVNGKWYSGNVDLYCAILDRVGDCVGAFDNISDMYDHYIEYEIRYQRKYERYGLLGLKRKEHLIHISEEYTRVFPLFVKECEKAIDRLNIKNKKKLKMSEITDGLPGSLLDL